MTNTPWEKILVDQPIHLILRKYKRKTVDLDTAAQGMECVWEIADALARNKISTAHEQDTWKQEYVCNSLFSALGDEKGGYKQVIEISEKSPALAGLVDLIETQYGGSRITLQRIVNPRHADIAEKLVKARSKHREQQTKTV